MLVTLVSDLRLISVIAALRAGGMRVRWRDVPRARRALRAGGGYAALHSVFAPSPREREVFDAVVLGGLEVGRPLGGPSLGVRVAGRGAHPRGR